MGYYYGKAKVTKNPVYHALSLIVPILWHTFFDLFLIALQHHIGPDGLSQLYARISGVPEAQLLQDPFIRTLLTYAGLGILALVISLIALILCLRKISVWSKQQTLQESIE